MHSASVPSAEYLYVWYSFSLDTWITQSLETSPENLNGLYQQEDSVIRHIADTVGFDWNFRHLMRQKADASDTLLEKLAEKIRGLLCEFTIWKAILWARSDPLSDHLETYLIELGLAEELVFSASSHSGLLGWLPTSVIRGYNLLPVAYSNDRWSLASFEQLLSHHQDLGSYISKNLKKNLQSIADNLKHQMEFYNNQSGSVEDPASEELLKSLMSVQIEGLNLYLARVSVALQQIESHDFEGFGEEALSVINPIIDGSPLAGLLRWHKPSSREKRNRLTAFVHSVRPNQSLLALIERQEALATASSSASEADVGGAVLNAVERIRHLNREYLLGGETPEKNGELAGLTAVLSAAISNHRLDLRHLTALSARNATEDYLSMLEVFESPTNMSWRTSWIRLAAEKSLRSRWLDMAADPKTSVDQLREFSRVRGGHQARYIRRAAKRQLREKRDARHD